MVRELAFINLFRSIAAFWVLAAHCMIWGGWYGLPLPSAKIAVDLFMMISGFLMASNALARGSIEPLGSLRSWLRFWLRRFFRLAPAYYVSLSLAAVAGTYFLSGYVELRHLSPERWARDWVYDPLRVSYDLRNMLWHFSFLFGLFPKYSFSTFLPDWSLSLEMQFYLVFPALFLLMQRRGVVRVALSVGVPSVLLGIAVARLTHYREPSLLFFKFQYFIAGILVFHLLSLTRTRARIGVVTCAVFLVSLESDYGKEIFVLPVLLLSMCLLAWLETTGRTPRLLAMLVNSRLIRFASDTSYGVYLFHGFFVSASGLVLAHYAALLTLAPPHRVLLMFVFVVTGAYLTAYIVYRAVELPGIRVGKRVLESLVRPAAAPAVKGRATNYTGESVRPTS